MTLKELIREINNETIFTAGVNKSEIIIVFNGIGLDSKEVAVINPKIKNADMQAIVLDSKLPVLLLDFVVLHSLLSVFANTPIDGRGLDFEDLRECLGIDEKKAAND